MASIPITGVNQGMVLSAALAFSRRGHAVAAGVRKPNAASDPAGIADREGLNITIVAMDVGDEAWLARVEPDFELVARAGS